MIKMIEFKGASCATLMLLMGCGSVSEPTNLQANFGETDVAGYTLPSDFQVSNFALDRKERRDRQDRTFQSNTEQDRTFQPDTEVVSYVGADSSDGPYDVPAEE